MGVQGLLPVLKSVLDQVHISKFKGKTVGVDANAWLYKGAYTCPVELMMDKNPMGYINYCMQQIQTLQDHGVNFIFVFDGAPLPAKKAVNEARARKRFLARQQAQQVLDRGGDQTELFSLCAKALTVTTSMIKLFVAKLRKLDINFIVAPYEADAQLAFLSRHKLIDAVISEDSDCVPYGCRRMLFKWNMDGWVKELERRSLGACEELSFAGWTDEMLVQLCVVAGCDYCASLPGIGIITAYKLVQQHRYPKEVLGGLQQAYGDQVPSDYPEKFYSAILTFRHHLVFDPRDKKVKLLNPLELSKDILALDVVDDRLDFLGDVELEDSVAAGIASGKLNPLTRENYSWEEVSPSFTDRPSSSRSSEMCPPRENNFLRPNASSSPSRVTSKRQVDQGGSESWKHLDGALGVSAHILNFHSSKVSDDFRPLVSKVPASTGTSHVSAQQLQAFETQPVSHQVATRHRSKRPSGKDGSGFNGQVQSHVSAHIVSQRASRKRSLSDTEDEVEYLGTETDGGVFQRPRVFESGRSEESRKIQRNTIGHGRGREMTSMEKWDLLLGVNDENASSQELDA